MGKSALGAGVRLTNSMNDMLDQIITIFGGNEKLNSHFAIAFTNCDEDKKGWKQELKLRKQQWKDIFAEKLCNDDSSKFELRMFMFSNVQDSSRWDKQGKKRWSHYKEFKKLYKHCCIQSKAPLETMNCILLSQVGKGVEKIRKEENISPQEARTRLREELEIAFELIEKTYQSNLKLIKAKENPTIAKIKSGIGCSAEMVKSVLENRLDYGSMARFFLTNAASLSAGILGPLAGFVARKLVGLAFSDSIHALAIDNEKKMAKQKKNVLQEMATQQIFAKT